MKPTYCILFGMISGLLLQSFTSGNEPKALHHYELQPQELVLFGDEFSTPLNKTQGYYKRSAYDLSRYIVEYDTAGIITLKDVRGCEGIHQNELSLLQCKGSVIREDDHIFIKAETPYHKFYLFTVNKNTVVDSFNAEVMIGFTPQTLEPKPCRVLVSSHQNSTNFVALPEKVKTKKIYAAMHGEKTVGVFTNLVVKDKSGKEVHYPAGDYVIVGGNSLVQN